MAQNQSAAKKAASPNGQGNRGLKTMQKTVCILLSDKRSGSTLFQREMVKHPQVQTVQYCPHTYLETHHWLKGAVITGASAEGFSGKKVYQGYGSIENAKAYTVDTLRGNLPDFKIPKDNKELIFKGWDALCEKYAQPVFFEKSPQHIAHWAALSLLWEWAQQTQFTVKFVGLTRNPLSVQYSAFKLFYTDPQRRQYGWLENQKNLLAFKALVPARNFLSVKYEEMIENPQELFQRVFTFLGLPRHPQSGSGAHQKSLDKWRQDQTFTLQLDPMVAQMAAAFGYTAAELYNPPKPEPSAAYKAKKRARAKYNLFKTRLRDRVVVPLKMRLKKKSNWK
jgi:hypothetical protein